MIPDSDVKFAEYKGKVHIFLVLEACQDKSRNRAIFWKLCVKNVLGGELLMHGG